MIKEYFRVISKQNKKIEISQKEFWDKTKLLKSFKNNFETKQNHLNIKKLILWQSTPIEILQKYIWNKRKLLKNIPG